MACGLCPGYFSVWRGRPGGGVSTPIQWVEIKNLDSWTIDANVQEATKKRTSSTKGLAVKFCEDVTDYTATVTTTLCAGDWLFCNILDGDHQELGNTVEGWWFFGWKKDPSLPRPMPPANWDVNRLGEFEGWRNGTSPSPPEHEDGGAFLFGKVVPPGFGGDNTATDPSTATFTINITAGPLLPLPGEQSSVKCSLN